MATRGYTRKSQMIDSVGVLGSANGNRTRTAPLNHASSSCISLIPRTDRVSQFGEDRAKTSPDGYTWLHACLKQASRRCA